MNTLVIHAMRFATFPAAMAVTYVALFVNQPIWIDGAPAWSSVAMQLGFCLLVFVLSTVGALVSLWTFKRRIPSNTTIRIAGSLFSIVSMGYFGLVYLLGGATAFAIWLVIGAAIFTRGATFLGRSHDG